MTHELVALLPIKAHSERVEGKNFRPFAGKPLFRWILDTLTSLAEIEKVVINTDARDLLAATGLVETDRIMIRDRKPEICGDLVSMNLILGDDIENVEASAYLMTHVTNPNLSAGTIRRALQAYDRGVRSGPHDSLFSATRFQSRFYRADGSAINHDPGRLIRTQDLEAWFEENSCLYVFSKESFHGSGARIGRKALLFETPRIESIDIDDRETWELAEAIARGRLASA